MTKFSVYAFNYSYAPDETLICKDGYTHSPPLSTLWFSITKFDCISAYRPHISFRTDIYSLETNFQWSINPPDVLYYIYMELILLAYGLLKETVAAIMILYKNTKVKVRSPDGDTEYFDIVAGVLQGDTLAP